jgi:hypothetical protein
MITIEASIVAMVMLSVVLDRAIHLYRPGREPPDPGAGFTCLESARIRTFTQSTPNHLLDGNYLFPGVPRPRSVAVTEPRLDPR